MATDNFPLHEAQLVALFMESIFYGIYLVSFAVCMRVLLFSGNSKRTINKALLVAAMAMGVFATLSLAFQMRHVLDAFIWYQGPGGALAEFEDISYWLNVMQTACYSVQTLIGDLVLIYRCYVVYSRRWIVIALPLVVWIGTLVSSGILIRVSSNLRVDANINEQHLVPWVTSLLALTMVQNLATTSLIAYRIWDIDRQSAQYRSGRSKGPVVRMIIESGAVYTLSLVIFLVLYVCDNNAQYPVSVCIEQIIGIVFNIIIIRVHDGQKADQEVISTTVSASLPSHRSFTVGQRFGSLGKGAPRSGTAEHYNMKPVQVNVTRQVVNDLDNDSTFGDTERSSVLKDAQEP